MIIPRHVRIVSVDHNGYTGREYHPHDSDIGLVVQIHSIEYFYPDSDDPLNADVCLMCRTENGHELELMEHEVEWFDYT
jgi:hypothetical protein